MKVRRSILALCGVIALSWSTTGCGSALTLTVEPGEPQPPELLPAPQLSTYAYRKVLLLPPEGGVALKGIDVAAVKEKKSSFYMSKLEKVMLAQGFEVISSEVVARAAKSKGSGKLSAAEKALVLGKQTQADAVMLVQTVSVRGQSRYFAVDEVQNREVEASHVVTDEDGLHFERETEQCLVRLPHYEVSFEAKMLDTRTGAVLWVGSARSNSADVIQDTWEAELDDDCTVLAENFRYADYQAQEGTYDNTVTTLLGRLIKPLRKAAFEGEPRDPPPPPKVVEKPPPPPPEEPKPQMATVSAKRASLRLGPGKSHKRKMRVPRKAKVEVLETMGEWYKVKIQDGTVGWMHDSTLIVAE
ncbi:MAG: SH3 domain-containing protein [Myxococcales bacterium]|nr:SH3 domain-containing protein [Myxococcales bacterium]